MREGLQRQFPQLEIVGGNHPVPASKMLMARMVQVLQFGVVIVTFAGDLLFVNLLKYPANGPFPSFYESMREKKMMVALGSWFVGNSIAQGFMSTGAFEIAYDGKLVYSKLATGSSQLPSITVIASKLTSINPQLQIRAAGAQPRPSLRSAGSSGSAPQTRRGASRSQPLVDDDDTNADVHDLAYDEYPSTSSSAAEHPGSSASEPSHDDKRGSDEEEYGFFGNRVR